MQTEKISFCRIKAEKRARVGRPHTSKAPSPIISLLAVTRRHYCFGSLVVLVGWASDGIFTILNLT